MQADSLEEAKYVSAAILALRAGAISAGIIPLHDSDRVVVSGTPAWPMTVEQAARYLATVPKPLAVALGSDEGGSRVVTVSSLRDTHSAEWQAQMVASLIGEGSNIGAMLNRLAPEQAPVVLVIGGGLRWLTGGAVIESWIINYALPGNVSIGLRPPSSDELAMGAQAVMVLGRVRRIDQP